VAAGLEHDGISVVRVKGGLGELSVSIEDKKLYEASRLWYPTPENVLKEVRGVLATINPTPGVDDEA
jgi:hypothetical protein